MTSSHPFRILSTLALVAALVAVLVGLVHLFRWWSSGPPSSASPVAASGAVPLPEVSEERLRQTVHRLSSVESRVTGYPGADEAARYIESEFRRLGMRDVRAEAFPVTVPVDRGASLTLVESGEAIPLRCVWPNLVRTPTTPGIRGRLIYAADGEFTDFDGKDVSGSVVLMDFNSGDRWINAGILGAKAVVFIAPDSTTTGEAEGKFAEVPVTMPRFYVEREAGERLRKLAASGDRGGGSRNGETEKRRNGEKDRTETERGFFPDSPVPRFTDSGGGDGQGVEVEVQGRMTWEAREGFNVVGTFPGTDPKLKDQTVVLSAYYDGMSVVPALAPAAEMACGIAGLLELGEMLRARPPARTVVFLATSGHCQNLRGIDAFMQRHGRKNAVFAGGMRAPLFPKLFLGLDLSSGNDGVMVWDTREVMGASQFDREKHFFGVSLGRRLAGMAQDIAARMGRRAEDLFANAIASAQSDKGWGKLAPGRPLPIDSEYVLACGTPALSFVTTYDARLRVDSPLDRLEGVRFDNLRTQVVFLGTLLGRVLNEADVLDDLVNLDMSDNAWGVEGRVKAYSRYAIVPDIEMGGAVAVLRSRRESKSSKGVRGDYFEVC
ncbi:hypothetical protein HYY27_00310, partial [bacterium]|nr:hypothetical protein [bacterium]